VQVSVCEALALLVLLSKREIHPWNLRLCSLREELVALRLHHHVVGQPVPEFNADLE
jgi:hypothetical protein